MADFPLNQNLPPGNKIPGIYTSVIIGGPGGRAPNNRVLCWGYMSASGNASPNAPFLGIMQEQVDQAVGPNLCQLYGRESVQKLGYYLCSSLVRESRRRI